MIRKYLRKDKNISEYKGNGNVKIVYYAKCFGWLYYWFKCKIIGIKMNGYNCVE